MTDRKNILRRIGGLLFAALLIPAGLLFMVGVGELIRLVAAYLPDLWAVILIVLIFFIIIVITAVSKIYTAGGRL